MLLQVFDDATNAERGWTLNGSLDGTQLLPGLACNKSILQCRVRFSGYRCSPVHVAAILHVAAASVSKEDVDVARDSVEGSLVSVGDELDHFSAADEQEVSVLNIPYAAFRPRDCRPTGRRFESE